MPRSAPHACSYTVIIPVAVAVSVVKGNFSGNKHNARRFVMRHVRGVAVVLKHGGKTDVDTVNIYTHLSVSPTGRSVYLATSCLSTIKPVYQYH